MPAEQIGGGDSTYDPDTFNMKKIIHSKFTQALQFRELGRKKEALMKVLPLDKYTDFHDDYGMPSYIPWFPNVLMMR